MHQRRWAPLLLVPTWYLAVIPEVQCLIKSMRGESIEVQDACKTSLYDFFEKHLAAGKIALGEGLGFMDEERKPIDTVVIHHTSNPPGLRRTRLSAIELVRLYGPFFAHPTSEEDQHLKGLPVASGHVRDGKQVFWPYHWMVRQDGHAEHLLDDSEIGWHAGDWGLNCRSVAIALDGDYERAHPSRAELKGIAELISSRYPKVPHPRIVGHRELNPRTTCPSQLFLDGADAAGWKSDLLDLLRT